MTPLALSPNNAKFPEVLVVLNGPAAERARGQAFQPLPKEVKSAPNHFPPPSGMLTVAVL